MSVAANVEALYGKHKQSVYRVALRYACGNVAWAEDITQDVFVKLCEVVGKLEELDDLGGWFYRVTTNMSLNRLERDRFIQATPVRWVLKQTPQPRTPEFLAGASQEMRLVLATVRDMPPKQAVVFCMKHLDGKSQIEIGEILSISKGYVSKLLTKAEDRVRRAQARSNHG